MKGIGHRRHVNSPLYRTMEGNSTTNESCHSKNYIHIHERSGPFVLLSEERNKMSDVDRGRPLPDLPRVKVIGKLTL